MSAGPDCEEGRSQAAQAEEKDAPARPTLVQRRQVRLDDGRYLIYYTFEPETAPRRLQ